MSCWTSGRGQWEKGTHLNQEELGHLLPLVLLQQALLPDETYESPHDVALRVDTFIFVLIVVLDNDSPDRIPGNIATPPPSPIWLFGLYQGTGVERTEVIVEKGTA